MLPFPPRKTPLIYIVSAVATVVLISASLHPATSAYVQQPIHDYFSRPVLACPSVHDIGRTPLGHSSQICHYVPSKIPSFELEVCYTPGTCNQYTARIRRTSSAECSEAERGPDTSEDPALSRWMREQKGPDAFYVRTDGAERTATVYHKYEKDCTYSFDLSLKNPGDIYLQIWWTYERYTAFSETNSSWPAMLLQPLSDPIYLQTCPSHCKTQMSAPISPQRKIVSLSTPSPYELALDTAHLPNCSSPGPIYGSYIPAHPIDVLYPLETLPQPAGKPVVGRYGFVPEQCVWRHAGLRFGDPSRCSERPATMFITGDSHGRVAYDSLVHRLRGRREILLDSEKVGSKSAVIGQLNVNFLWDPRGTDILSQDGCNKVVKNSDVLIVSTVAHWDDATTSTYLKQLRYTLTGYAQCPYTPPPNSPRQKRANILLYAPVAVQRQDQFIVEHKDHGTNLRMHYWRDESLKVAKELGWQFVDQFDLTEPHSLEPLYTDAAHFLANDAIDPIVDELLGKSELCD